MFLPLLFRRVYLSTVWSIFFFQSTTAIIAAQVSVSLSVEDIPVLFIHLKESVTDNSWVWRNNKQMNTENEIPSNEFDRVKDFC